MDFTANESIHRANQPASKHRKSCSVFRLAGRRGGQDHDLHAIEACRIISPFNLTGCRAIAMTQGGFRLQSYFLTAERLI